MKVPIGFGAGDVVQFNGQSRMIYSIGGGRESIGFASHNEKGVAEVLMTTLEESDEISLSTSEAIAELERPWY